MKQIYLLLTLPILIFSCAKGEEIVWQPGDDVEFSAHVRCVVDDKEQPDQGASLLIFENFWELENYFFQDGKYINMATSEEVLPTAEAFADKKGIATLKVKYSQKCVSVVVSATYPDQYVEDVHSIKNNQSHIGIGNIIFKKSVEE